MKYYIKKREWKEILKVLSVIKGIHKNNTERLRCFIEGVWFVTRTGCQWRLLPKCYGCWRATHSRFKRWSDSRIWEQIFEKIKKNLLQLIWTTGYFRNV